jgi:hypothetical protein
MLTDTLPYAAAWEVLLSLAREDSRAVRSTAFNVSIEGLEFRGAPDGSCGALAMLDHRNLRRKARFYVSASFRVDDEIERTTGVDPVARTITKETGLPFDKANSVRLP